MDQVFFQAPYEHGAPYEYFINILARSPTFSLLSHSGGGEWFDFSL